MMDVNNIFLDESILNIMEFEQQAPDLGSITKYYFCKKIAVIILQCEFGDRLNIKFT
jgi:hypothetical protein